MFQIYLHNFDFLVGKWEFEQVQLHSAERHLDELFLALLHEIIFYNFMIKWLKILDIHNTEHIIFIIIFSEYAWCYSFINFFRARLIFEYLLCRI